MNLVRPIVQQTGGIVRGTLRIYGRVARGVISGTFGAVQSVRHMRAKPKPGMDDVTLARKVETEIFRPAGAPKGSVEVNVVDGIVYLRGEVKRPDQMAEIEARARKIPEVRSVENLLHLPKTPARTRADSPGRARRTGAPSRPGGPRKTTPRARSNEQHAAPAECSPREAAADGAGRRPAPFGSKEPNSEECPSE